MRAGESLLHIVVGKKEKKRYQDAAIFDEDLVESKLLTKSTFNKEHY